MEITYKVTGMTCEHCEKAVTGEIGALPGVEGVRVDLATGLVTVTGTEQSDDAIRAAVDEAGYELAGRA